MFHSLILGVSDESLKDFPVLTATPNSCGGKTGKLIIDIGLTHKYSSHLPENINRLVLNRNKQHIKLKVNLNDRVEKSFLTFLLYMYKCYEIKYQY